MKDISINIRTTNKAFGGGNQWAKLIKKYLKYLKFNVSHKIDKKVDMIIMVDPRGIRPFTYDIDDIIKFKKYNSNLLVIHRINECDKRKNTNDIDSILKFANKYADYTVFVSKWLRDYHAQKWFDVSCPHAIINNAADSTIFNPYEKSIKINPNNKIKLITHHWSDNWNKGYKLYQQIDNLIYNGDINNIEFHVIGRWPKEIKWKSAICKEPLEGKAIAKYLKSCDLYITGSLYDPCGMHQVEAAQCGLPIIYTKQGGGNAEMASRYGVPIENGVVEALDYAVNNYTLLIKNLFNNMPSSYKMLNSYISIIDKLLRLNLLGH